MQANKNRSTRTRRMLTPAVFGCTVALCLLPNLDARPEASQAHLMKAVAANVTVTVPLTLQRGTPFSIALDHRVRIARRGEHIEGTLVQPVFAFDRIVAPAGSKVLGDVTAVENAPRKERVQAIMQGDFSPLRSAQVEFHTLVLRDGRRIPIQTRVSPATGQVVHLEVADKQAPKRKNAASRAVSSAKRQLEQEKHQMVADIEMPGRVHRLKEWLISQLPYHRQYLPAGARFTAELKAPVGLGSVQVPVSELQRVGSIPPSNSIIEAVLVTPLSSATARRGTPADAMVTQPVFGKDHQLVVPEGSMLEGSVVQVERARRLRLHRNGILRFTFLRIQTPHGVPHAVVGSLQAVDVAKKEKLKLDSEGGVHSTTSKMDYAEPAIAVLIAATSATPDTDVRPGRVYTDTNGPASGQIIGGGLGYKVIGMAMALAIRFQPVTAGFAAYGAAMSVYSHLLSRGQDVVFPKDTPMEILLNEHRSASSKRGRQSISDKRTRS
jgi:hypothetical protein